MEDEAVAKKKSVRFDPAWEFDAPMYYDFCARESEPEKGKAESWFAHTASYGASPHAGKSKPVAELLNLEVQEENLKEVSDHASPGRDKENDRSIASMIPAVRMSFDSNIQREEDKPCKVDQEATLQIEAQHPCKMDDEKQDHKDEGDSPCTPKTIQDADVGGTERKPFAVMPGTANCPGSLPAKRFHTEGSKEVHVSHPATSQESSMTRSALANSARKESRKASSNRVRTLHSPDDPANKKQKLEGGKLRQIKEHVARPHEQLPGFTKPQEFKFCTEKRSRQHAGGDISASTQTGKAVSPFVSMAQKVLSFQCKTPERFHVNPAGYHEPDDPERRKILKLTRPKTPDFETSHRVERRGKMKSTAELEEEMLAKIPKFKARPAPKKILGAHTPAVVQKSAPHMPEVQEFHFRTTERALRHKGSSLQQRGLDSHEQASVATSLDSESVAELNQRCKSALPDYRSVEPREPHLHTAARLRAPKLKSREDMELEEISKMPKFKSRPLNRKIFESRGDLGLFRNNKREVTIPQEFHFATDERIHHQDTSLEDQLARICLNEHSAHETSLRPTVPDPFHLETETRGLVKEMRFLQEVLLREQQVMEARVPMAHRLPFTTDVPSIPPKPEPKECTRPEPFQLESLVRHEEELQKYADERQRANELEASLRAYRAMPNNSVGPVFVPARSRRPLTEFQEFIFQLETRNAERAEFDQRVREKQNQYKRFREECEAARKVEEERGIKAMRREMVPTARPMPSYDRPFVPQRSTKELTRPTSPQFNVQLTRMPSSARRRSSSLSMANVRKGRKHAS